MTWMNSTGFMMGNNVGGMVSCGLDTDNLPTK